MTADRDAFIAELKHWRDVRGISQSRLAKGMGYDRSYISKIESGIEWPAPDFARRADEALSAGGSLRRSYSRPNATVQPPTEPCRSIDGPTGEPPVILVEHEEAVLRYDTGVYYAAQHRRIFNCGNEPISRYLIRISVDRYPGSPEYSNELYRKNPLTWDEIALKARCGDEPMRWEVRHDRDAFKELWLLFENDEARFPLYPGQRTDLRYTYTVGADKWGQWFQRAVRLPTRHLTVTLDFPTALHASVWGMETSMTAETMPFRNSIDRIESGDRTRHIWSTDDPPLHARYRLEWRFRRSSPDDSLPGAPQAKPSQHMAEIGIVQNGDPVLTEQARPFALPAEAEDARRVVAELMSTLQRASALHQFSKGMGIAAPQIGIPRSVAIVKTPGGQILTLLNPTVVEEDTAVDQQYEGCLSFFDVRGKVPRPLTICVEHIDIDGLPHLTTFSDGVARLVCHEIDHLSGVLYTTRMPDPATLIPVERYRGTGNAWQYGSSQ